MPRQLNVVRAMRLCSCVALSVILWLVLAGRADAQRETKAAVLKTSVAADRQALKPAYATPAETKLRAALNDHLSPLLDFKLDSAQLAALRDALKRVAKNELDEARSVAQKLTEPTAVKLVEWKRLLRRGAVGAEDYAKFLRENPKWPRRRLLQQLYEVALLKEGGSAKKMRTFFTANPPVSGAGLAAFASAEAALGRKQAASKLAAQAWCRERIPRQIEADFLARFGEILKPADHRCRLDRLLIANPRSRSIRRSRVSAATRLLPYLAPAERQKAKARIKAFGYGRGLKELRAIVKKPELVKGDWGLAFQRATRSRKQKDYAHAYKILKAVPGDHPRHVNRDEWWVERQRHARYWLGKGNVNRAYALIESVRPESANPAKEQAFLAGWLALMRLNRPGDARDHFKRMVSNADGPLSKSMSEFWLARAYSKLGNKKQALAHYKASAEVRDTFHGLLSRRAAWPKVRAITLPPAQLPTPGQVRRFLGNGVVKGLLVAYQVGLPRRDILAFYKTFGRQLASEGELALLAQLASAVGDGQGEVRTGKSGVARGFNLYEFAYPVHMIPDYKPLRAPVEPAMLLAIGRQESEFNTRIVSRAGARGVLQVMPITAKHICRQYRIKCKLRDLLDVPSYNTRIASAYIADRRDEFGGSYILTLTGFNAGPGRTRQWLRRMGDPRSPKIEPLDWIYRIPFQETRLYVRKVLSNVQIYRARLGERQPLRLDQDLRRGRK
ncbi:MAG: transglycosylase SLT domain-containing protein [Hyphomicrobiaceae bacterium]